MTKNVDSEKCALDRAKYVVSFISLLSENTVGYSQAAEKMINTVNSQPGFIAAYSTRNENGVGITNSYWTDLAAISDWKAETAHQKIQKQGKQVWYEWYQVQVSEIIRSY